MLAPFCGSDKWQLQSAVLFWDMDSNHGSARAFFDALQETQWLSREELEAYQRQQLRHILLHAARTTLFYKNRLAPVVRPDGDIDFNRWHEIPIVRRSDLQNHQAEMWSDDVPKNHGRVTTTSTSGSTGHPVEVRWAQLSNVLRQAARWRTYLWHGFDFNRPFAKMTGDAQWPEGATGKPWGPPWTEGPRAPLLTIEQMTSIPRLTEWIHRKKIAYFSGLSMLLPGIAQEAVRQKLRLDLACMVGLGMQATVFDRETITECLGIPVFEIYSSMDCGQIAHQCASGSLHVLSELVLVELLDEHDRPCPPGAAGRVIVTVLHNSAQPLIRYELGDVTAFAEPCRCGRSLPVITPISGRLRHMFKFDGDHHFAPTDRVAYDLLKPLVQPSWYQIAQTGPRSIEVRFVPQMPPRKDYQATIRDAIPTLLRRTDIAVSFKQFDTAPTPPGKKHIMFVNEHTTGGS